ncbi:MAG: YkgJ family cysteine cluster protein [Prolixibacteraceae bacterium]|nr:YkgJ family cysteine cluster protein [Prolixibacteraceae bacterium]
MIKDPKEVLKEYRQLRNEIDARCTQLHREHKNHTQCRKGCSGCCMDFRLLPVEFHYILNQIINKRVEVNLVHEKGECVFLVNDTCSIYEHRPVICRSHGLPILFTDEKFNNLSLTFCPLNFKDVPDDYFSLENSYDQDTYNQKLFSINQSFIKTFQDEQYAEKQMIEMSRLVGCLG